VNAPAANPDPERERFQAAQAERMRQRLDGFPAPVLAALVTVPRFSLDLFTETLSTDTPVQDPVWELDAALTEGLIELAPHPAFGQIEIEIAVPGGPTLSVEGEVATRALRAGLVTAEETKEGVDRPGAAGDEAPPPLATEPIVLAMPEVRFRGSGLRFWSAAEVPPGRRGRLVFSNVPVANLPCCREEFLVVGCRGDAWSGYQISVLFRPRTGRAAEKVGRAWQAIQSLAISSVGGQEVPWAEGAIARCFYHEFAMPNLLRGEVLRHLRERREVVSGGDPFEVARRAAAAIERLRQRPDGHLPCGLEPWADLAGANDPAGALNARLAVLLPPGQSKVTLAGEAQTWLAAARLLVPVMGGWLESATALGERQLELAWRKEVDARALDSQLKRPEQAEAVRRLLDPAEPAWALHFIGVGGVGKTMLVRRICAELVGDRPYARLDFDYLSADYPAKRPGQLLLELAVGLRVFAGGRGVIEELFRRLAESVEAAHEQVAARVRPGEFVDPLIALHDESLLFPEVLGVFAEYLYAFEAAQIVFILDTCEELAREQVGGDAPPAVRATFETFLRLRQALAQMNQRGRPTVPDIRMVFSGRRLLAPAGAGWKAAGARGKVVVSGADHTIPEGAGWEAAGAGARGKGLSILGEARPYLRAFEVRGFTDGEAKRFLTVHKAPPAESNRQPMSSALVEAILRGSPEMATERLIQSTEGGASGGGTGTSDQRYSPFDLALYADWYLEDPQLDEHDLTEEPRRSRAGGLARPDPYVEMRILQRLRHPRVRACVPTLVALRRVDRDSLQSLVGVDTDDFEPLFRDLCQLEWLDYQTETTGECTVSCLAVSRNLLHRLERYFGLAAGNAPATGTVASEMRAAIEGLVGFLRQRGFPAGPAWPRPEYTLAALRFLPVEEVAERWGEFELRARTADDWRSLARVCGLAMDSSSGLPVALRAHVVATSLAASLHLGEPASHLQWGESVRPGAGQHPLVSFRSWLADLAELGMALFHAADEGAVGWVGSALGSIGERLRLPGFDPGGPTALELDERARQLVAFACRVIEAEVENAEQQDAQSTAPSRTLEPIATRFLAALSGVEGRLGIWARVLEARASILAGAGDHAGVLFREAADAMADLDAAGRAAEVWLHWVPPDRCIERVRAEWLRARLARSQRPELESVRAWQAAAVGHIGSPDADRFMALALFRRLDQELVPALELVAIDAALEPLRREGVDSGAMARGANLHRDTPPVDFALARAWLALGKAAEAERVLRRFDRWMSKAPWAVQDPVHAVWQRERLELDGIRIERRMRRAGPARARVAALTTEAARWEALPLRLLVLGDAGTARPSVEEAAGLPTGPAAARAVAAWWESVQCLDDAGRQEARQVDPDRLDALAETLPAGSETRLRLSRALVERRYLLHGAFDLLLGVMPDWLKPDPQGPGLTLDRGWSAHLWYDAVVDREFRPEVLAAAPGPRAVAEWALADGELLAVRVPRAGRRLLELAVEQFRSAGDPVGEFAAAVRIAIALVQETEIKAAIDCVQGPVAAAYDRLRALEPALPAWPALYAEAAPRPRNPPATQWLARIPDDWQGWVLRLAAAIAATGPPAVAGNWTGRTPRPSHYELWRRSLPSTDAVAGIEFALKEESKPETPAAPPKASISLSVSFLLSQPWLSALLSRTWLPVVALVGILGLAGWGVHLLIRGAAPDATWEQRLFQWGGGTVFVTPLAYVGWLMFKGMGSVVLPIIAGARPVFLRVRRSDGGGGSPPLTLDLVFEAIEFDTAALALGELRRPVRTRRFSQNVGAIGSGGAPWEDGAVLARLRSLSHSLRRGVPVLLDVDAAAAPLALEAALHRSVGDWADAAASDPGAARLDFDRACQYVRHGDQAPLAPVRESAAPAVAVLAGGAWQPVFAGAWKSCGKTVQAAGDPAALPAPRQILHLVGRPLRIQSGFRLGIEGPAAASPIPEAPRIASVRVAPTDLPLHSTPLVVVQAEPRGAAVRLDSDRQQDQALRAFASSLFDAGASAVLLLPALPEDLAGPVVQGLARVAAGSRGCRLKALLPVVAALRELVAYADRSGSLPLPLHASLRLELALQITLFARGGRLPRGLAELDLDARAPSQTRTAVSP
jgi:hypothetical protein